MILTTLQYGSTEKSLADWGVISAPGAGPRREVNNTAQDTFAFNLSAAADAADPFPFGAKIIVRIGRVPSGLLPANGLPPAGQTSFTGGAIFFVGWRVAQLRSASAALESFHFQFAGPWEFFLERLVFQKLFLTWNGSQQIADYRSQVVLGQSLTTLTGPTDTIPGSIATTLLSISQQIREIAAYAIHQTTTEYGSPQFQFDALALNLDGTFTLNASPGTHCKIPDYVPGGASNGLASGQTTVPLRAPLDAVQDITCAEALRRMLRWIGGIGSPVVWFDYTLDPPALKISTRDQLPAVTLPAFGAAESFAITRRDDLISAAIDLIFRVTVVNDGVSAVQVYHDLACAAGATDESTGLTDSALLPNRLKFGAQVVTLDFEGPKTSQQQTATLNCIPLVLTGATDSYACWKLIFPELQNVTNLSGGFDSVTDPETGADVDFSSYGYILRDPGLASWMRDGATAGLAKRVLVKANFAYTEHTTEKVARRDFTAHLTLTNLPSGDYTSPAQATSGEEIPWGLASYIWNIEKIPQYQGTFTLQEAEITDPCPIGHTLNLSGSANTEWASMNACVQQITYDLDTAATTYTFGPAPHLGARDLAARLRVNRTPRLLYLVGANLLNS